MDKSAFECFVEFRVSFDGARTVVGDFSATFSGSCRRSGGQVFEFRQRQLRWIEQVPVLLRRAEGQMRTSEPSGDEEWRAAEDALRASLERAELPYDVDEGGGAFYGPKIDLKIKDAIGREWQLSTIQFDFNNVDNHV